MAVGGARSSLWGVGWVMRCGVGCVTLGAEDAVGREVRAERKSSSAPNSSSDIVEVVV